MVEEEIGWITNFTDEPSHLHKNEIELTHKETNATSNTLFLPQPICT